MNTQMLQIAITIAVSGLLTSNPTSAQVSPTTPKAAHVQITKGPEIEMSKEFLTIIRWTTNNPGGSPEHYGIVHYGTDPKYLNQTAKSPIRLNPDHALTVFRVRMEDLKPGTTYYYRVGSLGANGTDDGTKSTIKQFTTPGGPQTAAR
jgi:phosphodiesterase/alkaline phosphatase D-like protein